VEGMKTLLKSLVIDTATPHLYLALYEDKEEVDFYYKLGKNDHSVKLMVELEKMLHRKQISMKDIDQIIIGVGPGSYTGLRVGVVVAKMFGWTLDKPVFQISSLALLASSLKEGLSIPAVDARRGNAFLGLYETKAGQVNLIDEEKLMNLEDYQSMYKDAKIIFEGKPNLKHVLGTTLLEKVEDIHQLTPNYLRVTEAEKNARK